MPELLTDMRMEVNKGLTLVDPGEIVTMKRRGRDVPHSKFFPHIFFFKVCEISAFHIPPLEVCVSAGLQEASWTSGLSTILGARYSVMFSPLVHSKGAQFVAFQCQCKQQLHISTSKTER